MRGMKKVERKSLEKKTYPYTPATAAGLRIEDPVSLPTAKSNHSYAATAQPPPDDEAEQVSQPSPRGLNG
jgi:hypothetical protein